MPDVDVEFGRLQARDMLQHLWTGPISNASVDVVQGSRSVEVRAVGVTKVSLVFLPIFSLSYGIILNKIILPKFFFIIIIIFLLG